MTSPEPGLGLLGADLERDADGQWTVTRVLPGESSDPRARSPLAAPGAQVGPGDTLLAVDGRPLDGAGPGPLLVGAAGKPVELTVAPAGGGEARRAVVVTLAEERRLRYQDWVAGRRQRVRELSDGRIGYLHVPDMVSAGWADFHRDLRAEMVLRRADRRRAGQPRRAHLAAGGGEAGPAGDRLGRAARPGAPDLSAGRPARAGGRAGRRVRRARTATS